LATLTARGIAFAVVSGSPARRVEQVEELLRQRARRGLTG
jgi:beta-phosphoglucomutase-like phosphatase (HAD superfamily)